MLASASLAGELWLDFANGYWPGCVLSMPELIAFVRSGGPWERELVYEVTREKADPGRR
jgi:hypothetical protein